VDHLTKMVLAAEAAGMSYGKYVALVHEGLIRCPLSEDRCEQSPGPAPQQEERRCEICGRYLAEDSRWNQKTCGPACSAELNRLRNRDFYSKNVKFRAVEKIPCRRCGELFLPNRKSQKFCGVLCQHSYNKAKARARRNGGVVADMTTRNYGTRTCRVCGEEFIKRSWNQEVCSRECRSELDEIRRRRGLC
jgi:predicted nucleic acid-binding Zn ribbon protein